MHRYSLNHKLLVILALIILLMPTVSLGQESPVEQQLLKAGYSLSVTSARLKLIREDIAEISKKYIVLNEIPSPEICYINLLIENIFLVETICVYESILLNEFARREDREKFKQFNLYYTRLNKDTLKRLYLNYKSVQTNFANISHREISKQSDGVKTEMLNALNLIEQVKAILQKTK